MRRSLLLEHILDRTHGSGMAYRFVDSRHSEGLHIHEPITRVKLVGNILKMANRPVGSRRKAQGIPRRFWRFSCKQSFLAWMALRDLGAFIFGTKAFKAKRKEKIALMKLCVQQPTFSTREYWDAFESGEFSNLPFSQRRTIQLPVTPETPLGEKFSIFKKIECYGVLQTMSTLEFDHLFNDYLIHVVIGPNHSLTSAAELQKYIDYRRDGTTVTIGEAS